MTSGAPPERAFRGSARALVLGTFLAVLAANVLTGSREAPATGDGVEELNHFAGETIPRPQHLAFVPAWRLVHGLLRAIAPSATPLTTIVLMNSIAGAAAVALAVAAGLRLGAPPRVLAVAAATLAFAHAWWMHSRDPESAMIANAMLTAAAVLLLPRAPLSPARRVLSMLAFGIAAAFAANTITTLPLFAAWEARASRRPAISMRSAAIAAGFVAPFLAALAISYATHRTAIGRPLPEWAVHHSSEDMMGTVGRGAGPLSLVRAGSGFLRCFFPLEGGVPTAAKLMLTGRGADAAVSVGAVLAFAAAIAIAAAVLLLLLRAAARAPSESRAACRAILAGLVGTTLGCWIWIGSDPQFWLPILPFVLIGAACGAASLAATPFAARIAWIAAAVPLALFLANRPWPTPSIVDPRGGPTWQSAATFCATSHQGDLLVTMDTPWSFYVAQQCSWIRAFRPLHGTSARGDALLDELGSAIDATRAAGGRVILEDFESAPGPELIGFWENMALAKGVPREQLVKWLHDRGDLVLLQEAPGRTLRELAP